MVESIIKLWVFFTSKSEVRSSNKRTRTDIYEVLNYNQQLHSFYKLPPASTDFRN
jgi:hypothetical protein